MMFKPRSLKLLMGYPAQRVHPIFMDSVVNWMAFGIPREVKSYAIQRSGKTGIDVARNEIAKKMLDEEFDQLYFWDADMWHPANCYARLLNVKQYMHAPVLGGVYYHRRPVKKGQIYQQNKTPHTPHIYLKKHPMLFHEDNPPLDWRPYMFYSDIFKVDGLGTGCVLIDRSVMLKLEAEGETPFFRCRLDERGKGRDIGTSWSQGEDFWFCDSCRKHDIPLYADTTILGIKHITEVAVSDEGMLEGL